MKARVALLAFVLVLALLLTSSGTAASAESVLYMPAALRIIEEEAFYGSASFNKVVLPDGVTEINARAFANSTLSEINLPDSLTFIEPSAFDGPEKVTVTANPGTYAYDWAVDNHYIILVTSITLDQDTLTLAPEETAILTAEVLPGNATDKTVAWTTSDASVATVEDGAVTAVSVGTASITATAGGRTAECAVTVEEPAPAYAAPVNLALDATGTVSFTVTESNPHTVMLGVYKEAVQPCDFSLLTTAYADGADLVAVLPIPISGQTSYTANISNFFDETAEYYVAAKAVGSADEENARDMGIGNVVKSDRVLFTRPSIALAAPTGVAWSSEYGRATWNAVTPPEGYEVAYYQVMLYSGNDIVASRNINTTYFDFSSGWINFQNAGTLNYTFTVTAMSSDIMQVSNSAESAHSSVLRAIDAADAVRIITQPSSMYVSQNAEATVSIAAAGIGVTYEWYVDDQAVSLEDDVSILIDTSALGTKFVYCVVRDALGNELTSSVATVTVIDDSPRDHIITTQPADATVDPNSGYTGFYVGTALPGYFTVSYTWYLNDGDGWRCFDYGDSVTLENFMSNDGARVKCVVTATAPTGVVVCEETSRIATFHVTQVPIQITHNLDNEYWTAGTDHVYITAEGDNLTYQWYVNDGAVAGATSDTFMLPELNADATVFCRITTGSSHLDSYITTIHVGENPATGISIYKSYGPDTDHLVVGDMVGLRSSLTPAKATSTVTWTSSDENVATVSEYGTVTAVGFGTATITAEANGHTATRTVAVDSYIVEYNPNGGFFNGNSTAIYTERVIAGQNASLPTVAKTGDTFLGWTAEGETVISSLVVNQNTILIAKWELSTEQEDKTLEISQDLASNQYAKIGNNALFEVVTNGAKVLSYQWMVDDGNGWRNYGNGVTKEDERTSLEVLATAENNGWQFKVVITPFRDQDHPLTSNVCTLTTGDSDVSPQTEGFSFTTQPADATLDAGQEAVFTVAVDKENAVYQWQKDGVDIAGETGSSLTISSVTADDAGSYTCVVTVGQSTMTSNAATLTVNEPGPGPEPMDYTVTYDANGGYFISDENNAQTLVVEGISGEYNIDVESPIYESHTFLGWATSDDASADDVITSITVSENITLYAVWEENTIIYTITYHGNGGLFDGEDETLVEQTPYGQNYSVEANWLPEREGYTFVAWGDENGVELEDDNFVPTGDMDLYAIWEEDEPQSTAYTVTYYANGGAFPGGATNMSGVLTEAYIQDHGSYVGDLGDNGWVATPEREGYEFRGWSEDPDWVEGDMAYDDGSLNSDHYPDGMAITGDVSLYACWVAEEPEILTDLASDYYPGTGDGFEVEAEGIDLHYRWQYKMPGYDWTDVPNNDSNTWNPSLNASHDGMQVRCIITDEGYNPATTTTSSVATFHWTGFTVTYSANGGLFEENETTLVESGIRGSYTLTATQPTKENSFFQGWADENGNAVSGTITVEEDTTLYAVWQDFYFITQPEDTSMYTWTAHTITARTNINGARYQWYTSGDNGATWTEDQTGMEYEVYRPSTAETLLVKCTATYNGLTITSNVVTLTITPVPTFTVYGVYGEDQYTVGDNISLYVEVSIQEGVTVSWEKQGNYGWVDLEGTTQLTDGIREPNRYLIDIGPATLDMNGLQIHAYVQRELSGLMDPWDGYFTLNVVAVPEPVSYTVTYYANGGAFPGGATSMSGVLTDDYIQENGSYVGDLGDNGWVATPEREGYEFRGWSEDPDWVEGDMAYDDGSLNSDHYPDGMAITGDVSLYACWVAEQPEPTPTTLYTVTYDANGGTFGNSESTRTETSGDRVYTVSSTTPTMAGYDFSHWTLSNGNVYHPDEAIELNGDIMFTAQWTEHYDDAPTAVYISVYNEEDYTFYTDFYGGDTYFTVDSAVEGTGGSGLTYLWEESYDRSSWMEASWGDSESATLDYIIPGMSGYSEIRFFRLTVNGVHSNIATVRVVMDYMGVYCATLDANGGRFANGDTERVEVFDGYWTGSGENPTRIGYTFSGWMLDGQLTAESFDNYSDMTLVAVWEQNLSEYTVTYDANGGTFSDGTGSRSETSESTIYAISDQIPTLDGYRFTGWQLNGANVSGTIQATGENLTLTAQWIQRVTLTYDGNGGTFSGGSTTATSTYDINTSHGFWTTGPIKSGALFDGWQYEDGSRVGTRITQTDDLTVYAIWVTESTITLDAGEGTFADGSSQKTVTVAVDGTYWPNETPELSGYVFDGWLNRDQYGTPVGFVAATQARITLIASWIEDYAVRPDSVTITADQDSVMYEYDCYGPGMGGASMSLTSSVEGTSINDPYSLYYHWQVSEDQSTWSSVYDEYGTVNTGTGFTSCTAWFDYEGIRYFRVLVNGVCSNVVRVNVTSDWDDIPNVLTYDANGGMFGNGSIVRSTVISYYYSQTTLDTYEPPRRFGYSFQGWTLDGVLVESIVVEGDVTVYASWTEIEPEPEPATYTVTYYANGGAFPGGATSMSGVLTDDYIQENGSYVGDLGDSGWVATPEREGYEFRGWSEDPDWVEGDMAYDDGSLNSDHYPDGMAITGDVSLYACWVAEEPQRTLSVTMDDVTQSAGMGAAFFAVASWSDGTEVTGAGYRWYTLNDGNWVEISGTHGLTTYYVATTIDMNGKRYKVVVTCDGQEASAEATLMVGYRVLYDAYYGEFPGDVGRYIDIIVTEGGCNVGDLGNGNTVPDPTREGYEFGGWYDAYFQVEYEMGSWIEVNDNITLFAYWPAPAPEPEDLTVTIWADSEYLTVLEGNPEDSDNLHIWSSVEGVTGDLTYQWQQKTWWNDDFVDTWSMGDDETTFYLNGTSVEDGTTYRLVVNGIPSNEITIGVYHEYPQDVCPECGGTDGSHYEWCSLMGGVNDEWWCDICGTFHQYGEDCPNA